MKRIKFISLLLLLVLIFDMPVVNAGGSSGGSGSGYVSSIGLMYNVYNIPGQTWYTKLIDLTGYKGKDVSGTLEFELVPDNTASGTEEYNLEHLDFEGKTRDVKVTAVKHPGFQTFKYEVPFSSDDFVDPEFNRLCNEVKSDFGIIYTDLNSDIAVTDDRDAFPPGPLNSANDSWIKPNSRNNFGYYNEANLRNYIKLFNHAFMHEWGTATESPRLISKPDESPKQSDDMVIYHSTRASRSQFKNDEDYNNFLADMGNNNLWANWENDPEKHVAAWECFRNLPNREMNFSYVAEPDKAIKESRKNLLSKDKAFSEGKFSLFDHSFKMGSQFGADLVAITRPIAISKKYDASGNIVAIEKPLLPSVAQMAFESMNSYGAYKTLMPQPQPQPPVRAAAGSPPVVVDDDEFDVEYHIFRYILREKQPKGIALQIPNPNDEIIVDFVFHKKNPLMFMQPICYVNIYKDRASADAYKYRFPKRYKKRFNINLDGSKGSTRFEYSRYTSMEFCHEITDSVQVKNKYIPPITPTPTVSTTPTVPTTPTTPQSYPRTGDSENVWVYGALLALSIAMAVFIKKKRYSNK